MENLTWNGESYSIDELMDSVVDGMCGKCGEVSGGHEPDARDNDCPVCGTRGSVTSVPMLLGLI